MIIMQILNKKLTKMILSSEKDKWNSEKNKETINAIYFYIYNFMIKFRKKKRKDICFLWKFKNSILRGNK